MNKIVTFLSLFVVCSTVLAEPNYGFGSKDMNQSDLDQLISVRANTPEKVAEVLNQLPQDCRNQIFALPYRGSVVGRIAYIIEPLDDGKLRATSGFLRFSDTGRIRIFECDLN